MDEHEINAIEAVRRSNILLRFHLELQRQERSLDNEIVNELIDRHPRTVSPILSVIPNFRYRDKFFKKSVMISEVIKSLFLAIFWEIKNVDEQKKILFKIFEFLRRDNIEEFNKDLTISAFFIRNRAVLNIFGENTASAVEKHSIDLILDKYDREGVNLYLTYLDGWGRCLDRLMIPHLYIAQVIHRRIFKRINFNYSENPIFEHGISDIILKAEAGAWLKVLFRNKLIW